MGYISKVCPQVIQNTFCDVTLIENIWLRKKKIAEWDITNYYNIAKTVIIFIGSEEIMMDGERCS